MEKDILSYVKKEDLPDGCRELVDVFGIDLVMELVDYCGGSCIYLPSKSGVFKSARNRVIKEEFNGGNYKELASKFGISDIQIRKIVKLK